MKQIHIQEKKQFKKLFKQEQIDNFEDRFKVLEAFLQTEKHVTIDELLKFLDQNGWQLDPDFDLIAEARPFVRQALILRYSPNEVAKRGWKGMAGMMDLLTGLPKDFRRLLRAARRGALRIHIDIAELERFGERLDRAASRITIGPTPFEEVAQQLPLGNGFVFINGDMGIK